MSYLKFAVFFNETPLYLQYTTETLICDIKNDICKKLNININRTELFCNVHGKLDLDELLECPISIFELDMQSQNFIYVLNYDKAQNFINLICTRNIIGCMPIQQIGKKLKLNSSYICTACLKNCRKAEQYAENSLSSETPFICKCALLNDGKCKYKNIPIIANTISESNKFKLIKAIYDNRAINHRQIYIDKKRNENMKHYNRKFDFDREIENGLNFIHNYNNKELIAKILKIIPKRQENSSDETYVKQLLKWFKEDYFTWCNAPKCFCCNKTGENMEGIGMSAPYEEELKYKAYRVEVYNCKHCQIQTRFPRYNDCIKLLDTRTGRCGEWANTFGSILNAVGFKVRFINNGEDHVWNEYYNVNEKRWIHLDPCENAYDTPLVYEQGWKRVMTYILAFSVYGIADVTPRYIKDWRDCQMRRNPQTELQLKNCMEPFNMSIYECLDDIQKKEFDDIKKLEDDELNQRKNICAKIGENDLICRQSGSEEWRRQRGEIK